MRKKNLQTFVEITRKLKDFNFSLEKQIKKQLINCIYILVEKIF